MYHRPFIFSVGAEPLARQKRGSIHGVHVGPAHVFFRPWNPGPVRPGQAGDITRFQTRPGPTRGIFSLSCQARPRQVFQSFIGRLGAARP